MEISAEQQKLLEQTGKKYNLTLILLHGSYATGKQYPGSDLDIAFLAREALTARADLQLGADLAKIFGNSPERELDVKSLRGTNPLFLYEVSRDSQLLYGSDDDYQDFLSHAFVQYHDSADLFELEHLLTRRLLKRLRHA